MNYPILDNSWIAGGYLIALIAVFHVFIAHFAVGGGLFLVLTERWGHRTRSRRILEYVRRHTKFFLLVTMVLGSITGVGIWLVISVTSPAATSVLIHEFAFGWATEWVFFVGEIVALFVYFYTFGKMEPVKHMAIGWLYFAFAWASLFIINGILTFMLTPGAWLETGSFWHGFFNRTFWPATLFRTFMALSLAGLFGFLTSAWIRDRDFRLRMVRWCAAWLLTPFVFTVLTSWWYLNSLADQPVRMILAENPRIFPYLQAFIWTSGLLVVGALVMAVRMPGAVKKPLAVALMVVGIAYIGSFEWVREGARRPYLVYGHIYSNSIFPADLAEINRTGALALAKWTENRQVTPENRLDAGRELYRMQCLVCHSIDGPSNPVVPLTSKFDSVLGMDAMLDGQGKLNRYMPYFAGTRAEREALAAYIVQGVHGKSDQKTRPELAPLEFIVPAFDEQEDDYVLLAWNNLGMHCISDSDMFWILLPPGNDLYAQLIRRGPMPKVVTRGVTLTYEVQEGFENPSARVRFWDFSESLVGAALEKNKGISGNGLSGEMKLDPGLGAFTAEMVPVVPYPDSGGYDPYPTFTIRARDAATGQILVTTRTVAPTSTEMGCKNCHGGPWKVDHRAGISDITAADVLKVHDKNTGSRLMEQARAGRPVMCQSCHPDPVVGAEGQPGVLNLPAALHGWHANYLTERGAKACNLCHPNDPNGATMCLRGIHATLGLECMDCHGTLEDHALSLLKYELKQGKPGAAGLMAHLTPRRAASVEEINPRKPWHHQPDCLTCHENFQPPMTMDAFNVWTDGPQGLYRLRHENTGQVMCQACHGATHAIYPAGNPYARDLDNIVPLQYQGNPYPLAANENCKVCHTMDMILEAHHPNSLARFRNTR